ncbi:MAG: hypothetical protein H6R05_1523 [Burkholderiaceae bacterium]|nr:hypothetical protein [Burkholderiaceae bacterium]
MILATIVGFIFPHTANLVLPYLPMVLFFLMFFTLMAINQHQLIQALMQASVWRYAVLHTVGMSVLFIGVCYGLGMRGDLLLAIAAIMATGSLFATPAIVRSIGFEPLYAMALTIASTLIMPIVLFVNLWLFQTGSVSLDMVLYVKRLLIFIAGPMAMSAWVHRWVAEAVLLKVHQQLSKVTMLLVMSFPFGLIGRFRSVFDTEPMHAWALLILSMAIVTVLFWLNFYLYRKSSIEHRISAAVASGGRNVLLTLTISAPFLGTQYLALIGAMQLPIYALPLVSRAWMRWQARIHQTVTPHAMTDEDDVVL